MQSHRWRYGGYLILILVGIGGLFWYRMQYPLIVRGSENVPSTQTGESLSDTTDATPHITDIQYTEKKKPIITIGKTSTKRKTFIIAQKSPPNPDTENDPVQEEVVSTSVVSSEPELVVASGSVVSGDATIVELPMPQEETMIVEEVTEATEITEADDSEKQATVPQTVIARQPHRTNRQGKKFAHEVAATLSSDTLSLENIQHYHDREALLEVRKQTKDPDIYALLVHRLQTSQSYDMLVSLRESNTDLWTADTPVAYVRALWETDRISATNHQTIRTMHDAVERLRTTGVLSGGDVAHFDVLFATRSTGASHLYSHADLLGDASLQKDLADTRAYYDGQRGVPTYYRDALTAMVLMQHGYGTLAEKIAYDVLKQNDNYILPHQIIVNNAILKENRKKASVQIEILQKIDTEQRDMYQFLRGMVSYQQGNYADAVLLLHEVTSPVYRPDVIRYMIMSYEHLHDTKKRDQSFADLLQYELHPSDYYTYFSLTFFVPFQEGRSAVFDQEVTKSYTKRCAESIDEDMKVICRYGAAGALLALGQKESAHGALLSLYDEYPYSYIARALGDYYAHKDDKKTALTYYFAALRTTDSEKEHTLTKQKIRQTATQSGSQLSVGGG